MSDYMKEAERLLNDFALLVQRNVAGLASMAQLAEARAALLAHTQRGAVPEGERAAFESWIENEAGAGAARRWLNTEAYENGRVQDYRTGWIACLEWLAAPAPDQFRDAAKMVTAPAEVKLYAWRPSGHGEYSFYVASTSEEAARIAVQAEVDDLRKRDVYGASGWGTDYYTLECVGLNEVMTNDND